MLSSSTSCDALCWWTRAAKGNEQCNFMESGTSCSMCGIQPVIRWKPPPQPSPKHWRMWSFLPDHSFSGKVNRPAAEGEPNKGPIVKKTHLNIYSRSLCLYVLHLRMLLFNDRCDVVKITKFWLCECSFHLAE